MDEFDVRPNDPSLPYGALSGGNQQKALLAKWLQTEPRLLLLDEPTQGVDVGARQQIFELIRDGRAERGMRVLCASSDYEQLAAICDRVLVFGRGRICRELIGRRGDEGADHRAVLRCDGSRGRRAWSSVSRGARLAERASASRAAAGRPGRALRAARRLGRHVVVVRDPAARHVPRRRRNFTTIFGSQAILVVLTLALLVPLDRRRLRPLGRGAR